MVYLEGKLYYGTPGTKDEQKIITTQYQEEAVMDEIIGLVAIIKGDKILTRIEIKVAEAEE